MSTPKILIVDDTKDLVELYQLTFEAEGFDVEGAFDGLEGITKAIEFQPDIILLDIMMPQMDGYEFMKAIKKNSSLDVPIIINSNINSAQDIEQAKKEGASLYLPKADYDPDQVVEEVKKFLGK